MTTFRGYHQDLPFKKGDKVRIKRGTLLKSTHPQRDGKFPSRRTYNVTVHHTMPGMSMVVGHIYKDGTYAWGSVHWRDLYRRCRALGIDYGVYGPPDTQESKTVLEAIMQSPHCEVRESGYRHHAKDIWLHMENPSVVWPGSGGYWTEADINDVEKVA